MSTHSLPGWTDASAIDDVPDDDVIGVEVAGRDIALYKVDGSVFATDNLCTHGHARLCDGFLDGHEIECPLHQGRFDVRDGRGRTPLHVATHARHHDAIRALVAAGADIDALDDDRYDAVTIAAVADDEATLRVLLQLGASAKQVTSRYDGTALIAAAHLGHDGVVRQLIATGAPLDHVNNLHWTAVIESIVLGNGGPRHQATLQALLQAGASHALTDRQGNTPLQLARQRGFSEMVRMLETAGAR